MREKQTVTCDERALPGFVGRLVIRGLTADDCHQRRPMQVILDGTPKAPCPKPAKRLVRPSGGEICCHASPPEQTRAFHRSRRVSPRDGLRAVLRSSPWMSLLLSGRTSRVLRRVYKYCSVTRGRAVVGQAGPCWRDERPAANHEGLLSMMTAVAARVVPAGPWPASPDRGRDQKTRVTVSRAERTRMLDGTRGPLRREHGRSGRRTGEEGFVWSGQLARPAPLTAWQGWMETIMYWGSENGDAARALRRSDRCSVA